MKYDFVSRSQKHVKRTVGGFALILIIAILLETFVIAVLVRNSAGRAVDLLLNQIEIIFSEGQEKEKQKLEEFKTFYITQVKFIAYFVSKNPSLSSDVSELKRIADFHNINEINILDSTGKIVSGTEKRYYGMTLDSGEQMAYFKPMLEDKSLIMCQGVTSNTAEGKEMIYAASWTLDKTKIVQIGFSPDHLREYLSKYDISHEINNIPVTRGFDIYIVDLRNLKMFASTNSSIEDPELAASFKKKIGERLKKAGKGIVRHKGHFYYIDFRRAGGCYVAAASYCLWNSRGHFLIPVISISVYLLIAGIFIIRLISKLYRANNAKTKFLNNMSHDIRTPMNAILGYAKLLQDKKNDAETILNYVGKIQTSGEYLLSLINNVLDMARIESGKMELKLQPIVISEQNISILDMFAEDLERKKLSVFKSKEIQHEYVLGDKAKMQQVVVNLLSNAIKYTPEGGNITLNLKEFPSDKAGYAKYVYTVSDDGIGMSEEFKKHIFESFSREQTTTESGVNGTGLGMSIVKKLVEIMGGEIQVESEVNKGSSFIITMHLKIIDDSEIKDNSFSKKIDKNEFAGRKVLLVEDNDLNAEIATEILMSLGITVERAEDGFVCVQKIAQGSGRDYDLVLMDIQMPRMDGYEATMLIRGLENKEAAGVKIVAMTANAFAEDKQKAYNAGMNGHLVKPIEINSLIACLRDTFGE